MEPDAARGHREVLPRLVLLGQREVLAGMRPVAVAEGRHRRLVCVREAARDLGRRLEQMVDTYFELCLCVAHPFTTS
jgi:hypothetical protein